MQLRPEKMPLPAPANGMELRLEHGADIGIKTVSDAQGHKYWLRAPNT